MVRKIADLLTNPAEIAKRILVDRVYDAIYEWGLAQDEWPAWLTHDVMESMAEGLAAGGIG